MNEIEVSAELLTRFKNSIGDFNSDVIMDNYYSNFIELAIADLLTDDISESVLCESLGTSLIIIYAKSLMNGEDIASNPTIVLLRNKLSDMTKGERNV